MSPLESWFPNLTASDYVLKSASSSHYNCIGWVIGVKDVWDPDPNYRWARGVYRAASAKNVMLVLQKDGGFLSCEDASLEAGIEKVAIYGDGDRFVHVARQLEDGRWSSKIGMHEDIEHASLDALTGPGDAYGTIVAFMKRDRRPDPDWAEPCHS
jgi:hypothetical protein